MITGISLAGGPPNGFPPAAALAPGDLIYGAQAGSEVAMTIAQMKAAVAVNAARETFVNGTGFTAGTSTSITLAGTYGSINNILVFFDGAPQLDCTLSGNTLGFNPIVPLGISQVVVIAGTSNSIGTPADGTVTDVKVAAGTKLYNRLKHIVDVMDFGAKGDGVTDDTAAIQAAINFVAPTGGTVNLPPGTFNISATIELTTGVSFIGSGSTEPNDLTLSKYTTVLSWVGAAGGSVMVYLGNLFNGVVSNMFLDGRYVASTLLGCGAPQGALFSQLVMARTNNVTAGYGLSVDTHGQISPPEYPTQFPGATQNIFSNVVVRECSFTAFYAFGMTGTTFINCNFQSFAGAAQGAPCVLIAEQCDTNQWFGGIIGGGDGVGVGATALLLNSSTTDTDVYGNNFYGTAFLCDGAGFAVDCRLSATHNHFYGCYFPTGGTQVVTTNGVGGGLVKIWGATGYPDGNGFRPISQPSLGASPWTWTNQNLGYAVEFHMWGGSVSAVSMTRNGTANSLGGISSNLMTFLLEPGDSITITYSSVPTVKFVPH